MPTFCRHNRFIERCPICSKALPGSSAPGRSSREARPRRRSTGPRTTQPRAARPRPARGEDLRVRREDRAQDDGYRSELLPGVRASADASRLAEEIAFSSGRLLALAGAPPGLYAEARALAEADLQEATWICFLISYFSPLDGEDPFAGIRMVLAADLAGGAGHDDGVLSGEIPLGPRTSHDPARGIQTLIAYRQWAEQSGFLGDQGWSPKRRFERLFERLALPGFGRMGRYDLLVALGQLGLYELRADSLHVSSARGPSPNDPTTLAAKRLFAIGEQIHLERRAAALAQAISVPVEALDLAFANWGSSSRATLGFGADTSDSPTLARARAALGL